MSRRRVAAFLQPFQNETCLRKLNVHHFRLTMVTKRTSKVPISQEQTAPLELVLRNHGELRRPSLEIVAVPLAFIMGREGGLVVKHDAGRGQAGEAAHGLLAGARRRLAASAALTAVS